MNHAELAAALFAAFADGNADAVRRLCAPDLRARQNDGPWMNLETLLTFALAVNRVVKDFRYEEAVRSATDTGFVEEHFVRGSLPDGSALNIAACVVADVRDGKVSSIREYLDGMAAIGLLKALPST